MQLPGRKILTRGHATKESNSCCESLRTWPFSMMFQGYAVFVLLVRGEEESQASDSKHKCQSRDSWADVAVAVRTGRTFL